MSSNAFSFANTKCTELNFMNAALTFAQSDEFHLVASNLPKDLNFMPSLANGHLGFTVFGDAIYFNGVYNGEAGNSRRARLPNNLNLTIEVFSEHLRAYRQYQLPPTQYVMNLKDGYFQWQQNLTVSLGDTVQITQRIYAHRYFNRALIYELSINRTSNQETLLIKLEQNSGNKSEAFDIQEKPSNINNFFIYKALTRQVEDRQFQTQPSVVYIIENDCIPPEGKFLKLKNGQKTLSYRLILTADHKKQVALKEMRNVLSFSSQELLNKHTQEWERFWGNFHIEIEGSLVLSQIINAGIFYLANSLPSPTSNQRNNPYYGLSPTGLARGQLDADYQGHSFWDTEIWMLPIITHFNTDWSRGLLKYRFDRLKAANYNAMATGYRGARFPWESAFTGVEVTNPCCPEVAQQQIHISADIVLALQHFYAVTHDESWLCGTGWILASEIAEFLISRVTWNTTTDLYHVENVMGPDEDHNHVNDNAYTNVAFKKALEFASFVSSLCWNQTEQSKAWLNVAQKMFLPYNESKDYHLEYAGYETGERIKQADAILLGFPLQLDMANTTRYNDLMIYENVTRASGPAMTWSMFAINFLDVGFKTKADHYFLKGFEDYIRPEFKVWSETSFYFKGSSNFLTGIGGFLQSILYGYAGIRFHLDPNGRSQMLLKQSHLLPAIKTFTVKGIKFGNASFALTVFGNGNSLLTCLSLGSLPLELIGKTQQPIVLTDNCAITLKNETVTIQTSEFTSKL
uniref:Protein-glucosylgalactosylhydroxylysine glucosidase n=1 Tax=Glossina austeni TaxID=7395 RepID=A0A1A9V831_GLOAU